MGWAAAWLLRATGNKTYQTDFDKHWTEFNLNEPHPDFWWNNKKAGIQILMAKVNGDKVYKNLAQEYCDFVVNKATKTPKGMVRLVEKWGPLRHSTTAAFLCLQVR